ncbi:hypothetical protein BGZ99_002482, partial [Dissophora globulifera]
MLVRIAHAQIVRGDIDIRIKTLSEAGNQGRYDLSFLNSVESSYDGAIVTTDILRRLPSTSTVNIR